MKHAFLFPLLIASMIGFSPLAAATSPEPGKVLGGQRSNHPDWFKDSFLEIADDVNEAVETGKHVILFFHLEACPYCNKMVEDNFKNSSYTDYLQENFDVIAINIRGDREVEFNEETSLTEKELAQYVQVKYTPTVLFMDQENNAVLRMNGYRSADSFEYALKFVQEQAYQKTSLQEYTDAKRTSKIYTFRDHANYVSADDLSIVADKPLAVIFEDQSCDECDALYEDILNLGETRTILNNYTVVRLDARSNQAITSPDGKKTTPAEWAKSLNLTYRPGVVLFDKGEEIMRIDGLLKSFHFQQVLRFVGERHYSNYEKFRDFARENQQAILNSGKNIDIWK